MEKELQNIYFTDYYLLIAHGLWHALFNIFLKEFIKLIVNTDRMTKNMKLAELNINTVTVFVNTHILRIIY